jgi:hypothetical protein
LRTWSKTSGANRKSGKPRKTAVDRRTTRHPGCAISQVVRERIEEPFGWIKAVAQLRETRHLGTGRVVWLFTLAASRIRPSAINPIARCSLPNHNKWATNADNLVHFHGHIASSSVTSPSSAAC